LFSKLNVFKLVAQINLRKERVRLSFDLSKSRVTDVKSLDEIKSILKKHEKRLKEKYKIKEIGIFGSYVRGEARESSDVDILVEFEPDARISLLDFVELENYLSDILGVKVDLVEKSALKPRIGKQILSEVIYI